MQSRDRKAIRDDAPDMTKMGTQIIGKFALSQITDVHNPPKTASPTAIGSCRNLSFIQMAPIDQPPPPAVASLGPDAHEGGLHSGLPVATMWPGPGGA